MSGEDTPFAVLGRNRLGQQIPARLVQHRLALCDPVVHWEPPDAGQFDPALDDRVEAWEDGDLGFLPNELFHRPWTIDYTSFVVTRRHVRSILASRAWCFVASSSGYIKLYDI